MGVFIPLSDPIGLICGPQDRLPECASLVPIKLSRRAGAFLAGFPPPVSAAGSSLPRKATRGVPRRSKQHVASASPGVTHRRPALLTSAQRCSCFVTLVQPSRGLPGRLPSTGLGGRVVAPPVTRGVPRPSRIKQHIASALAAPWVTHCRPALLLSAQRCSRFVTPDRPSPGPHARRVQVTRIRHCSSSIRPGGLGGQPGSALSRSYPRLREDAEFYWIPLASLRRSRQLSLRSPGSSQGSPASHPQQAAHSLSLTRGHPPGSGSPRLCPTLLTLRNPGPAQLGITLALGPGHLGSSCGSSSRPGGPNCRPGSAASGSHSWHPGGC
ncbi:hypothetical protein NDU88_000075 [Pleurodeles waltl]|uniref:Uncharacterized protein n=1 Tax=Pleurodeles waltl TaxID=8319 RepID=A0AAV7VSE9_PLEWA|nr:hypothetical protein NDU88_000075 [Pleurodeles waltl]